MPTEELLRFALKSAKTGWNRYLAAVGAVILALVVDRLTGSQFLADEAEITVFGFKVLRPAFSFTYGALFGVFVLWAIGSSRTVRKIAQEVSPEAAKAVRKEAPECRLWTLSPISPSTWMRLAFWLLASAGMFLLGFVTLVHLLCINVPASGMSPEVYRNIGVFSAGVFVFAVLAFALWIYPAWRDVHDELN